MRTALDAVFGLAGLLLAALSILILAARLDEGNLDDRALLVLVLMVMAGVMAALLALIDLCRGD